MKPIKAIFYGANTVLIPSLRFTYEPVAPVNNRAVRTI
jgi:hypothetical protein